MPGTFFDL